MEKIEKNKRDYNLLSQKKKESEGERERSEQFVKGLKKREREGRRMRGRGFEGVEVEEEEKKEGKKRSSKSKKIPKNVPPQKKELTRKGKDRLEGMNKGKD